MLIVMRQDATQEQIDAVIGIIGEKGCQARPIPGGERVSIGVLYNKGPLDPANFQALAGVKEAIAVTRPYKLVSREVKPHDTIVRVGNTEIGGSRFSIIGGPCAVESESLAMATAEHVKKAGADIFRGGAFKPRTSPYAFQGLGEEGLKILAKVRETFDMPVVTEVLDLAHFDMVEQYADIVQIGTRNMQNFSLLRRAGESKKSVMLKRGMSATVDEWLMAAEYIMSEGNENIILCERGVRTFVRHSRNTLDFSAIPVVRRESHLPVIIDPSHASGYRDQVLPLARAAAAVGSHGLMVEVHDMPDFAQCDGGQSLYPDQFALMCRQARAICDIFASS
ncbi:3-deoxy-7-phosphoheptulonate synthase [Desulfosalsimonas propionicica]|uniref:3-deoxy-7-phosphoheptulonate synthase n=1 Tax=Desulfosalsimonas propionicica TaxID=332175 RepID=A0A7W0C822_9BACT|nr:3-deoxy-7-phosphoheptulonate synthase [Desulfosalsimonas propionicica]MBA2880852.1 3-deoxy-7-phosphoheptulonate synthase [Desulfosalsimonas propionicica]